MKAEKTAKKLIYPELSYKVVGVLFKVHSKLGHGHHERYYQRACKIEFEKIGLNYQKELKAQFEYEGKSLGSYFLDFLMEDKVVLELKVTDQIGKEEVGQVLRYLRKTNKKLGILANFGKPSLEYKRIINNEFKDE